MLALVLLAGSWPVAGPYVLAVLLLAGTATLAWWLWRTDRQLRGEDADWRRQEEVRAGRRTLTEADGMSGTAFEELVAGLCRRDGCTEVRRVGGAGDHGADVVGRLPDGRTVVVQCKRYAPSGAVPSRDLRELLGTQRHFRAEAAVFVTTTRFTAPAEAFARQHGILAVHRDHFGLWHSGTPLTALFAVNGAGQGDRRHRARWKKTYGT